jgi:hypothetical protein
LNLGRELGLHPRGISDFFDALVAMRFLEREGNGPDAKYSNTPAGALYLDQKSPRYVGGILEMLNVRLFKFWHDLPEALRTGKPQNEIKHSQKPMFEELYSDPPRLEQFMGAMTGLSRLNLKPLPQNLISQNSRHSATSAEPRDCFASKSPKRILISNAFLSTCLPSIRSRASRMLPLV